jgi:hypothetical protein
MGEAIVNKVAESGIITLDLEEYFPDVEVVVFDLADYLFMGLILREKEFRESLKNTDWGFYAGKLVAVKCSVDAIIPMWAYMLIAVYLRPLAADVIIGSEQDVIEQRILKSIRNINLSLYKDQRVVIKGCGEKNISEKVYLEIALLLQPVAKSIMYGEPCSTVPVFKKSSVR